MTKIPIAGPRTEGRTLGTDWSIAHVAKLLKSNAARGEWDSGDTTGSSVEGVNQYYFRKVSAKHLPTGVSLIFMRLKRERCWYASLCFSVGADYIPWNPRTAELWLKALFGDDLPRVHAEDSENPSVRQFTLAA